MKLLMIRRIIMAEIAQKAVKKEKVTFKRQIGWSSRAISISVNVLLMMQITYYCTNILGMSAVLAGTILLATKIFDGFTDLVAGALINKVRTRFGLVRHYELCIIPLWISTVLLFSTPAGMGMTGKSVWVFVFYALTNAVFATMLNSSDAVYLSRSLSSQVLQAKMLAVNGLLVILFSAVVGMVLPNLMATIGTTEGGWTRIALMFGVPMLIIGLGRFLLVKEIDSAEMKIPEPVNLGEGLRALAGNKYIFIVAGSALLCHLTTTLGGTSGTYYFQYIVGDLSALGFLGMLSLTAPVFMLFFPALLRKFGAVNIMRGALVIGIVGSVAKAFAGANIPALLVTSLISSLGVLPMSFMVNIYIIDCMTYGEWKTGKRADGFFSVMAQFGNKVGTGLASGAIGFLMGAVGFDGMAAVQSDATKNMIIGLYTWIPAIVLGVILLIFATYDLDKRMPQIKRELEARKAAASAGTVEV
jgi:GPH family glycoside/pentoside/hexuronide:cation symporter